ncbi:AraC family transcriptional regulator [Paenibacillus faecalis]|uniref:AraC family transcriptional regulator n=1 Tax=Paenibacillus faecalis TaxID=2079532 RepID=UPI000D0FA811|nr:AraC family transcriptional regulator [Paenibacillus faecalis]
MEHTHVDFVHSSTQGQMELSLLFFGREECSARHSWGPGLRDSYIIHYIHSGRGTFTIHNHTYQLHAGQGFLIPPEVLVYYCANEQEPWTYSWFGFRGLHAKSLLQQSRLTARHPIFQIVCKDKSGTEREPVTGFETFYEELMAAREKRSRDVLSLSILYRLMAELIENSPEEPDSKPEVSKEAYIRQAIQFIENNYSQRISVMDIARFVGLDRTYLSGLFKSQLGLSLQAFLLEYRMNRAKELLQNKELSISDISRSVGYIDPFLFSKMFKKVTGLSPLHMRNKEQ